MVRGCVISFVLMMLMWLVQCDEQPTQFDFIGGKYDLHKLPDQNTSGPFLVQVFQTKLSTDLMVIFVNLLLHRVYDLFQASVNIRNLVDLREVTQDLTVDMSVNLFW